MAGQQRYNYYAAGNFPADRPGYQGLPAHGQSPLAAGAAAGALPRPASAGSPVMRANTVYIPHAGSPVAMHQQPTYPRPPYPRYSEHDYDEHQQRQYEQYEQRSRYYREATPSLPSLQDYQPRRAASTLQHRPSVYQAVHGSSQQPRPLQSPRQHQISQLHAQRSLNLGSQSRLPISRDQLPTAPSPPASSATEPAPVCPESAKTEPQSSSSSRGPFSDAAASSASLPLSDSALSLASQSQEPQPIQYLNRNNTHSSKSTGSPVTAERLARPAPPALEATTRHQPPVISHNPYNSSSSSLSTLARSGTQSQWDPTNCAMVMQAKSRAAQANSYSRQFTLSSIPANEEVPPLPGKMASKTGKVRIQLTFDRPFFNAGGELSGRLEVQCSSSRSVMLADMIIELLGYEALAKDHLAPKVFHKTVLRLQDIRHPSQAVQEHIDPDAEGYWMARKGRTIFPFRLNIQDTLPNSYDSKLGHVRYAVSAIALMKANHHKEIVNHTREVFIYETWTTDDIAQARRKSVKADTSKRLFMGGEGSLEMYAELTRTMVSSGGIVYVNVGVKNLTKKKIMGIKLSLWRHIAAAHTRTSMNSQLSSNGGSREQDNVKNYSEIIYKGEDYAFDSDDPRVVVLPVYIPSGVYSLRNTSYLHVQFFVQVSLMASMSKALAVELPIYIAHASSWSDPPPRIPRDFCFPLHEDQPVKKNKTGVFTKKKPPAVAVHSTGSTCSTSSLKKSLNTNGCLNSAGTSASAPTSLSGTPNNSDAGAATDGSNSRPTTQRSTLKDPDSPTSVLDFSQAGNLFVVNPDAASIFNGSDARSLLKQPQPIRSVPNQQALYPGPGELSDFASPLDRSAPLTLHDQEQPYSRFDNYGYGNDDGEQDFDMSRSVNTSQSSPTRKDHEKPKSSKMGLRKTLAKLSIAIPSHHTNASLNMGKTSRLSPGARITATTPRSTKSLSMTSTDDLNSPGSDSPLSEQPLSRQSSGSSMGSFNHMFDKASRKSSIGSTRVMTVSPGPVSPDLSYRSQPRIAPSHLGSVVHSAANSPGQSASHSRATSPTFQSSASPIMDGHRDHITRENLARLDQLGNMPMVPDVRVQEGTPMMEEMGQEERFITHADTEHSSLSGSGEVLETGMDYSLTMPGPYAEAWDSGRELSTTITTLSEQDQELQTARGIRDEYYYGRSTPSSELSDEISRAPLHSQELMTGNGNRYSAAGQTHSELAVMDPYVDGPIGPVLEAGGGITRPFRDLELGGSAFEGQERQSPQDLLQENGEQPLWNSASYEHAVPEHQHVVHLDQGMALSPSAMQDSFKSSEPPAASTLFNQLPVGLILTPRQSPGQSPDRHYSADEYTYKY
ncbi:hypothetical protein BGZ70_002512 [Mortierella alpina]|uniref:Arrestin C-terminal-like domain-containing protein n=1 Tax=Mortierella alpina TaxID=64518 RepID=A0A9P6LWM4_MORAP|nr:hypothetical protein BGZ70_002512 [Mortierella alpina]